MTKFVTYLLLLISTISVGQANKTFKDSAFKVGDIIKIPDIIYVLDGNGHENDTSFKTTAAFINSHKNIVFELGCHSDSRGYIFKNMELTNNRARSIRQLLIKDHAVDSTQIIAKGYGHTKLIVLDAETHKTKNKEEREKLHAINRRTELKVILIK